MTITINGTTGIAGVDGSASTPAVQGTDTNTGVFFPAADTIAFGEGGAEAMRIDSSGNVGIGTTSPSTRLHVVTTDAETLRLQRSGSAGQTSSIRMYDGGGTDYTRITSSAGYMTFDTNGANERVRITSGGDLLVGKTAASTNTVGLQFIVADNKLAVGASGGASALFNRNTNDGIIVQLAQDGTVEGDISVSGTTVSYNGGHLSRYAQTQSAKDESLVKGTVLSNLDEMNVYTDAEGNPVDNEQLNKVKVSDVEGDVNVAGVFVNWTYDDAHQVDEINMAMTGDMIIRIAQGVVVQKGDLLMSAGDGTAKPQGDDIVRSKTVAKVTSNHVTCTYADGSYCVPCVLMAC